MDAEYKYYEYCLICGFKFKDNLSNAVHFSGIFKGAQDNHIHICIKCSKSLPVINFDELININEGLR